MVPIIDSMSANPSMVLPGGAFVVTIVAHDPDARSARLVGRVTDGAGNVTQVEGLVQISDPLSFELIDADGVGFTITPRVGQPGVFDVVAP